MLANYWIIGIAGSLAYALLGGTYAWVHWKYQFVGWAKILPACFVASMGPFGLLALENCLTRFHVETSMEVDRATNLYGATMAVTMLAIGIVFHDQNRRRARLASTQDKDTTQM